MEDKRKNIIEFVSPVYIVESAAVVGKKEGQGPLREYFDEISEDARFEKDTWEKAEIELQIKTFDRLLQKSGVNENEIECVFAGDLLNQCIVSSYAVRKRDIPVFGLYSACATFCQGLMLASMAVSAGYRQNTVVQTSSHYCTAERQYRFPLEYGGAKSTTAQWTVTGSGAVLLSGQGNGPRVARAFPGRIIDMGIVDANNMGAAMAPAAADTLVRYFNESGTSPRDYDLVLSGDLGRLGKEICTELVKKDGFDLDENYRDGGCMIYTKELEDNGGSGCGCIASVFSGKIMNQLRNKEIKNMILLATGALLSPTIVTQSESIPAIAHLVVVEN